MTSTQSFMELFGCFSREKAPVVANTNHKPHLLDRKASLKEPLTSNFFIHLLDLEEKIVKNQTSVNLIKELTMIYAV